MLMIIKWFRAKKMHVIYQFFGPFLGIFGPIGAIFFKFEDKNRSYSFFKLVHQSKIFYMSSSTDVDDDKMILAQKDSRTVPFLGHF